MRKNQWPPRYLAQRGWSVRLLAFAAGLLLSIAPTCAQDVLRIPYVADIGTFDPDNGFEIGALSAIDNVYEGLVEYQPGSTRIVGLLAKNWDVSDDGLTYTFHLVEGVRFHDGTPCDAAAVVKSFERRRDDKLVVPGEPIENTGRVRAAQNRVAQLPTQPVEHRSPCHELHVGVGHGIKHFGSDELLQDCAAVGQHWGGSIVSSREQRQVHAGRPSLGAVEDVAQ